MAGAVARGAGGLSRAVAMGDVSQETHELRLEGASRLSHVNIMPCPLPCPLRAAAALCPSSLQRGVHCFSRQADSDVGGDGCGGGPRQHRSRRRGRPGRAAPAFHEGLLPLKQLVPWRLRCVPARPLRRRQWSHPRLAVAPGACVWCLECCCGGGWGVGGCVWGGLGRWVRSPPLQEAARPAAGLRAPPTCPLDCPLAVQEALRASKASLRALHERASPRCLATSSSCSGDFRLLMTSPPQGLHLLAGVVEHDEAAAAAGSGQRPGSAASLRSSPAAGWLDDAPAAASWPFRPETHADLFTTD